MCLLKNYFMKKIIFLTITALFFYLNSFAQLADGSIAPDWTLTDINGTEHNLYSYLDQGYTVIIDFSATWSHQCWTYHQQGILADLYTEHGPAGMPNVSANTTDVLMVFLVEGDGSTTHEDLEGTGPTTIGNWIDGTPHPIIDSDAITEVYDIQGFPTVYTICPDRLIQQSGQADGVSHYYIALGCAFAQYSIDISIISLESDVNFCSEAYVPSVKIQNLSTSGEISSATITASQGETVLSSLEWEGNLNTYEKEIVELPPIASFNTEMPIYFSITIPEDEYIENDSIRETINTHTTSEFITLDLTTDDYGADTSWSIVDDMGNEIASGSDYSSNETISETITLPTTGCYNFIIKDSYDDGICCIYGEGSYSLKDNEGNVLAVGGEFGSQEIVPFRNDLASGVDELTVVEDLSIFPNPASEKVEISFDLVELIDNVTIEMYDVLGKRILTKQLGTLPTGNQNITLDIADMSSGIYTLIITSNQAIKADKLYIQK